MCEWFELLWESSKTHEEKTLVAADGKQTKINFKKYLINEIEKIFIEYSPKDLYYKVLFELFGNQILEIENDPEFNRQIGRIISADFGSFFISSFFFSPLIINASLYPVSIPRYILISQSFRGTPTASILVLILCSI